jgi:hypothetical protein
MWGSLVFIRPNKGISGSIYYFSQFVSRKRRVIGEFYLKILVDPVCDRRQCQPLSR